MHKRQQPVKTWSNTVQPSGPPAGPWLDWWAEPQLENQKLQILTLTLTSAPKKKGFLESQNLKTLTPPFSYTSQILSVCRFVKDHQSTVAHWCWFSSQAEQTQAQKDSTVFLDHPHPPRLTEAGMQTAWQLHSGTGEFLWIKKKKLNMAENIYNK